MSQDEGKTLAGHLAEALVSWRSPFRAGFGLTCGAATAAGLISIGVHLLDAAWRALA